jgi:acyl-CoA synthetase (NDP forming)/GNAT superfamily N-acetyltransferase
MPGKAGEQDLGDLARWETDVVLSDGGTVHIRPIRPADAPRLTSLHDRLSRESRYLRFFSPMPTLSASLLDRFVTVDYVDRMALVAVLDDEIVGVARYDTLEEDPSRAEVAFTVDDAHQGRGVGTVLLEHLAAVAADRGLTRFVADTLPTNSKMLGVFRSAGFSDERHFADGVVRVEFPIQPTPVSVAMAHDRERKAAAASVRRLLQPRSVAVVGAGRAPMGIGHEVFRNLLRSGFTGPVYPVNTAATSVASVRSYPTLSAIPDAVDLVVIAVPAPEVPAVVDECGAKGVTGLIVLSGGFADAGPAGAEAQRALVDRARGHGMRLLGPNCMGVANADPSIRLNATLARELPPPGRVGFMAQSGALGVAIFDEARRRRIGVSSFVSAGNKADVSGNDLIQYWDEDPHTDVVLLYLESFGNPRTFARVTRRLSRSKPVVAVKGGRSATGQMVAGTPWSVPVGSDDVIDAVFRHTGVIRVDTLSQLFDVLVADACEGAGLTVTTLSDATIAALRTELGGRAVVCNPVTVAGTASAAAYERVLGLVLADPEVDAVIVSFLHPLATPPGDVAEAVRRAVDRAAAGAPPGAPPAPPAPPAPAAPPGAPPAPPAPPAPAAKTVVANFMAIDEAAPVLAGGEHPIPVFPYPESAAQALARVAGLSAWRARPEGHVPALEEVDHVAARLVVQTALAEHPDGCVLDLASAVELLGHYGVNVARTAVVTSADEAMDAAATVGLPVALKLPRMIGGHTAGARAADATARLGLRTPAEVARAWTDLTTAGDPPHVAVVQAMVPEGIDTAVQISTHPSFGPLLSFGTAGPAAEIYGDRALRVLPLTDTEAVELVRSVKGAPLLHGYGGDPPADLDSLCDLLLRVSRLASDFPEIAAIVLDPVIASPQGAVAVDAVVSVAPYRPMPELALRRLA